MKCTTCKKDVPKLEKHHIVPLALDGLDEPCNIVEICIDCHGKIHGRDFTKSRRLQAAGIARAKKEGKYKNNGGGRALTFEQFLSKPKNNKCLKELKKGTSIRNSAKISNISHTTAMKIKRLLKAGITEAFF